MEEMQARFVERLMKDAASDPQACSTAFAPSNIALCKYWGKRDAILNLPVNSSLSISLGSLGTRTDVRRIDAPADAVHLNGLEVPAELPFARRLSGFLDLLRPWLGAGALEVDTRNTIPTAAGLASSASGFAALVLALDRLGGWGMDRRSLSMLARLGSGSAARSVYDGFVQWHAGHDPAGGDSFAERIDSEWPELRIGIVELCVEEKPVGSRDGMNRTAATSALYASWPAQAAADLDLLRNAIAERDFATLGRTAERNALAMHATMLAAWPPLLYFQPGTVEAIHRIQRLRADGLAVYLTIDAGPNPKLLFRSSDEPALRAAFAGLRVADPFGAASPA